MQDVFVIDLTHRGVSVAQWLEHRSAKSEGLRLSLSHARDKTKKKPFSIYLLNFKLVTAGLFPFEEYQRIQFYPL